MDRATSIWEETRRAALASSDPQDCRNGAIDVRVGSRPRDHADAHRRLTLPNGHATPTRSVLLNRRDHLARAFRVTEGHEHLIEDDVVEYGEPRFGERLGKAGCQAAVALDQVREPRSAEARSAAQASTPRGRRENSGV